MIATLRKSLKSNASRIFLWTCLLFVILGGLAKMEFGDSGMKRWLAKLGQQTLTIDQYNHVLMNTRKHIEHLKQNGQSNQIPENIEKLALEQSVSDLLVNQVLDNLGVVINKSEISEDLNQKLRSLPEYFFNENNELRLDLFLQQIAPYTLEDLEKDIAREIKMGVFQGVLESTFYIPQFEMAEHKEDTHHKELSKIEFSLGKSREEVEKSAPSDKDLQQILTSSNPEMKKLEIPEKRSGKVWKFSAQEYGIKVTDEQIKEFYNARKAEKYVLNQKQIQVRRLVLKVADDSKKVEVKTKAGQLYQELVAHPERFEECVENHSSIKGLQTIDVSDKELQKSDPILVSTIAELNSQNAISPVIKTSHGFEIVQFVSEKNSTYKPLSSVEAEVKNDLLAKKFAERFAKDAQRVLNTQETNPEKIAEFAHKKKAKEETLALQPKTEKGLAAHLFTVIKGEYAAFAEGDYGYIILCDHVEKTKMPALKDVRAKVVDEYHKEQALKHLENLLKKAYEYAQTHTLEETAVEFNAKIDSATSKDQTLKHPNVATKVRRLKKAGALTFATGYDRGFLVRLDALAEAEKPAQGSQDALISKLVAQGRRYQAQSLFIASLYRHDKLDGSLQINDQMLPQILKES